MSRQSYQLFRCSKVTNRKIRKDLIFKNRLCFICLDNSHIASKCTSNYTCKKCEGRHNISICTKDFKNDHQNSNGSQNSQDSQNQNLHQNDNQTTTTFANNVNNILLQTACADIVSIENGCSKKVHILFDSGAQRSYITKELQKSLNLKPLRVERIVLNVFGKEGGEIMNVDVVKFKVETVTDKIFMEALCIPTISARLSNQNSQYVLSQNYPHLQGLSIANSSSKTSFDVDLLVGLDFYYSFITGNVKRGQIGEPIAIESKLGWILTGPLKSNLVQTYLSDTHILHIKPQYQTFDETSDFNFPSSIWDIESINMSKKDKHFYEKFENNLCFDGERYCVRLPFTESFSQIPDNFSNSFFRLKNLKVKLQNNDELKENYRRVLNEYESKGIIEKIDHIAEPGGVHYLPHRAIVKSEKETSKIRIVFDGSSYLKNELSINEFLEPGHCLLHLLYDVLLKFCLGSI